MLRVLYAICLVLSLGTAVSASNEHESKAKALVPELKKIIETPEVILAIKEQNLRNKNLTLEEIKLLDKRWAEKDGELISSTINNKVSKYLKQLLVEGKGLYNEIFIMDNKGLNVGQSGETSDYWQGDEEKWQKTFLVGKDAVHVSKIEYDDSSKAFQFQLSFSIVDGDDIIGAVTFGVNWNILKLQ